jgi:hypothetical protein
MQKRIKLSLKWTKQQLCMWVLERYAYLAPRQYFKGMFSKLSLGTYFPFDVVTMPFCR